MKNYGGEKSPNLVFRSVDKVGQLRGRENAQEGLETLLTN